MSHAIKHCAEMEPGCPPNAGEGNGLGKNSLYQYNYTASSASTKKKKKRCADLGVGTSRQSNLGF